MRRRAKRAFAARAMLFSGAVAVAACVEIATGPNGIVSIRRGPTPRAIILGDALRDSTGAIARLRPVGFDESGAPVDSVPFRFAALSIGVDTANSKPIALVVDSLTGLVRAASTWLDDSGRVATTLGSRLQIVDTFLIVPRPHSLTRPRTGTAALPPDTTSLYYDCRTPVTAPLQNDTLSTMTYPGVRYGNVRSLASRVLFGDSVAGDTMTVRRYLVQYVIESVAGRAASSIPTVTIASGAARPVVGFIARGNGTISAPDNPIRFDTTDATGTTAPRLRIYPNAIASLSADTAIRVVIRAIARTSATTAVIDSNIVVTLRRFTRNPLDGTPLTCPTP